MQSDGSLTASGLAPTAATVGDPRDHPRLQEVPGDEVQVSYKLPSLARPVFLVKTDGTPSRLNNFISLLEDYVSQCGDGLKVAHARSIVGDGGFDLSVLGATPTFASFLDALRLHFRDPVRVEMLAAMLFPPSAPVSHLSSEFVQSQIRIYHEVVSLERAELPLWWRKVMLLLTCAVPLRALIRERVMTCADAPAFEVLLQSMVGTTVPGANPVAVVPGTTPVTAPPADPDTYVRVSGDVEMSCGEMFWSDRARPPARDSSPRDNNFRDRDSRGDSRARGDGNRGDGNRASGRSSGNPKKDICRDYRQGNCMLPCPHNLYHPFWYGLCTSCGRDDHVKDDCPRRQNGGRASFGTYESPPQPKH